MSKPNFSKVVESAKTTVVKHSPAILTGLGIAGMVTATITAVSSTPKALALIERERAHRVIESKGEKPAPLTNFDIVKTTWKCYIPTVVIGTLSTACLIGAHSVNTKRQAALATAFSLSETAFNEYRDKVVETVGEKKEEVIRDKIAKERIEKDPVTDHQIIMTNKGETLCYDIVSGRYFKSDIETIRKTVNELNRKMINEMYISLNDFYYELGLKEISIGDELGWNVNDGLIEISFSSQLTEAGEPCLVINYYIEPRYDYSKLM